MLLSGRTSPISLASLAVAFAMLGCTGNVSGSGGTGDAEATATHAVVIIERSVDAVNGVRAEASARFVRVAASSSTNDAFRAIGAALDLPGPGMCVGHGKIHAAGAAAGEVAPVVELSDVGSVTLEIVGGARTRLVPRQLPDVTDVVSGVVYARATDAAFLPADSIYAVHVGGAAGAGGFDIAAVAPGDPSDVHVAGEDPTGRLTAHGMAIEIAWASDRSSDVVYADVQPAGVRCVLAGSPGTSGDALVHGSVSTSLLDDTGTLVVHRLRREPMGAAGVDDGEVRFDFARSISYVRSSP
jgi:hypothetical protein